MTVFFCAALFCTGAFCQSGDFAEGERLFRQNDPRGATVYLEKAAASLSYPKAFVYLSVAYYQLGMYAESIDACERGMSVPGTDKKVLAFNAGNSAFAAGDFGEADRWYSLSCAADPLYAVPVLNRANARLSLGRYDECAADYRRYLELCPDDPQKDKIEALLLLLDEEKARAEREKEARLAEEARIKEEEARIAEQKAAEEEAVRLEAEKQAALKAAEEEAARAEAERIAAEEAARRRKLLEDVAASLQNTETENMSAGAEGTVEYDYETELE